MEKISFKPIWFDSLGAKSTATQVKTPDVSVLIDPGEAAMQPSFPASWAKKAWWGTQAREAIKKASNVDLIVISHYHYDHFFPNDLDIYKGKTIYAKSPNEYINDSQRDRAEKFYGKLCRKFGDLKLKELMKGPEEKEYSDPLDDLPLAKNKDFGDYQDRREELLEKWRKRFYRRVDKWNEVKVIPDLKLNDCKIFFADSKEFKFGKTRIRFTEPLFHGIEYSRVGWIFSTIITYGNEKFIHSSDLNGIYIEDYAKGLVEEDPQVLILDGPATYLIPFMMNEINLKRCVGNTCKILRETSNLELMIYDHHLLREKKYKERTKEVWKTGEKENISVLTAAEHKGKIPIIDKC